MRDDRMRGARLIQSRLGVRHVVICQEMKSLPYLGGKFRETWIGTKHNDQPILWLGVGECVAEAVADALIRAGIKP